MSQMKKSVYSTEGQLGRFKTIKKQTVAREKLVRELSERNKPTNEVVSNKITTFPGKSIQLLFLVI